MNSKKNMLEEDLMISIQKNDAQEFITIIEKFNDWQNYLLSEEEQYFIHYAICNFISINQHKLIKQLTSLTL